MNRIRTLAAILSHACPMQPSMKVEHRAADNLTFRIALQTMASCSGRSISTGTAPAASRLCVARSAAQRPASTPLGAGLRSLRAPALVPAQQTAGFQHSAVCSATATDAPAETFQYQAEVRCLPALERFPGNGYRTPDWGALLSEPGVDPAVPYSLRPSVLACPRTSLWKPLPG